MATDLADPGNLKPKPAAGRDKKQPVLQKTRSGGARCFFKEGVKRGLKTGEWVESLRGS